MLKTVILEKKSKNITSRSVDSEIEKLAIRKRLSIAEQEISEGKLLDHESLKRMRGII
jgi:hypothetical protein